MKVLQSTIFRAVCAIVTGLLLIKYSKNAITWITQLIGVLFFISGVISCATYYSMLRQYKEVTVADGEGNMVVNAPSFPIVGLGSVILGAILIFMPTSFVTYIMYVFAALLILGALNQFVNLATISKTAKVGIFYWIIPSLLLLTAILIIVRPVAMASTPFYVLGWCMLVYGVMECVNALKIRKITDAAQREAERLSQPKSDEAIVIEEKQE